jgi:hypothetical protein
MKDKNFKEYFKFPLRYINSIMVNTSDNKRAFDFLVSWREDDKVKNYIVGTLNGEVLPIPGELEISNDYRYENCEIYLKDKKIMNIIVGTENAQTADEKYIVLELDTFKLVSGDEVTAYCLVDDLPLNEMMALGEQIDLHEGLIRNYKKKNWDYCGQAIEHLRGKWKGELDSFYVDLLKRISEFKVNDPGAEWDGIR